MDYELKEFNLDSIVEIDGDENYSRYLEDLSKMKDLQGVYIAYQNGKIVYVGGREIKEGFSLAVEKASRLICDDPVLIMQVGGDHARYLLKKDCI